MHAVSTNHRYHFQRRAGASLTLLLLFLMFTAPIYRAQRAPNGACDNSTVAGAWGPEFASRAEGFLKELQDAVKTNNKSKFAALVRYPIEISVGNKTNKVLSAPDLVRKYPSITTSLKETVLTQDPKCLFANGQGVMIGHGQIWFAEQGGQMKIITITLD